MKRQQLFLSVFFIALIVAFFLEPVATAKGKRPPAAEPEAHADHTEKPGGVHFPTSCKKEVQGQFDQGVAMLHSFWYEEAKKAFTGVVQRDPECAMGYWGIAMSFYHPLWEPPDNATLKRGWTYAARAKKAARKNSREKEYLSAIETFYKDSDRIPHAVRVVAYAKAMEQIHLHYPDDLEGSIFYALALDAAASPTDKTYTNQKKAGEILSKALAEAPDHPGVAHYLIHSYDSPELATQALAAARSYAKLAPAVPHALHMPSHIFTRLGLWKESVESNQESIAAAKRYETQTKMAGAWDQRLHAMDYLVYAYLQQGEDAEARAVLMELSRIKKTVPENLSAAYASASIPARYTLERRQWAEAASLLVAPSRFRAAEAITHFAHAVGSARIRRAADADEAITMLKSLHKEMVDAKEDYWAAQIEVYIQEAGAWVEFQDGTRERAVAHMRAAVDLEERSGKHPMTPGPIIPAREMLGDLLLQLDETAEALTEFETSLQSAPNRFYALYGAARAAERGEDFEKALGYYQKLIAVAGPNSVRAELKEAKAFIEKNSKPAPAAPPPSPIEPPAAAP